MLNKLTLEDIDIVSELHDALILSLQHDYENAIVRLTVAFSVDGREQRRKGMIEFGNVLYCAVDLPLPESSFKHPGGLWITSFARDSEKVPAELVAQLPDDILRYSIFNQDWYSETHIAARTVNFQWLEN
jgi:hypothetical protein